MIAQYWYHAWREERREEVEGGGRREEEERGGGKRREEEERRDGRRSPHSITDTYILFLFLSLFDRFQWSVLLSKARVS